MAEALHTPNTSRAAAWAVRVLAALALLAIATQITACGGGGDATDEPDKTVAPVVCLHKPALCK